MPIKPLPIAINATLLKDNMTPISRRNFLKIAATSLLTASGAVGLGGLLRFIAYQSEQAPAIEFDLGPAANYPIGSRTIHPNIPAVLIHTESGFSAISLVCTHLGCTVETKDSGFSCPCHGSTYSKEGRLLSGPAVEDLDVWPVELKDNGRLLVRKTIVQPRG